jgi:DNA-binding transcriptional ArsR family regulator
MNKASDSLLDALCTSGARARILELFFVDPWQRYYVRQVHQKTGQAVRAVQRELARLAGAGLLLRYEDGNRVYYAVDRDHAAFDAVRALVVAGLTGPDRLRAELAGVREARLAFVRPGAEGYYVLIVCDDIHRHRLVSAVHRVDAGTEVQTCGAEEFVQSLNDEDSEVRQQIEQSVEILSHKDDVLWHRMRVAKVGPRPNSMKEGVQR